MKKILILLLASSVMASAINYVRDIEPMIDFKKEQIELNKKVEKQMSFMLKQILVLQQSVLSLRKEVKLLKKGEDDES